MPGKVNQFQGVPPPHPTRLGYRILRYTAPNVPMEGLIITVLQPGIHAQDSAALHDR